MKKRVFALASLALFWAFFATCFGRDPLAELCRRAQKASVGLSCTGPAGNYFGTGTFISPDGIILTSSSVLPPGASNIKVSLWDGTVLQGRLIGVEASLDLALARANGGNFLYLPLGDSSVKEVGERVITLGNAFDIARSGGRVSAGVGVISGKYELFRALGGSSYKGPVLETDAPLNPGSDGGPLVDTSGAIVGVLSLNYSPLRLLGTAVPVDRLKGKIRSWLKGEVPELDRSLQYAQRFAIPPEVLRRWKDAVVAIRVVRSEDRAPDFSRLPPDLVPPPWLRKKVTKFLSRPAGPVTGVCLDSSGTVATSYYNVAGKVNRIEIRDLEGKWRKASILAKDEPDDFCLLKAEKGKWSAAPQLIKLGSQGKSVVQAGSAVFVLGISPDLKSLTVTAGIVSAASRNGGRLFQHDAAENWGNSGGAVIGRDGRFLGIAVLVGHLWPEWAVNSGIGFAVRADWLARVIPTLLAGKDIESPELPFLGVALAGPETGPVVVRVVPGFPADKAGMKTGDRIVKFGGKIIDSWLELRRAINQHKVGEKVEVEVQRQGKLIKLQVVLSSRPQ